MPLRLAPFAAFAAALAALVPAARAGEPVSARDCPHASDDAAAIRTGFAPALEAIGVYDIQVQLRVHGYDPGPITCHMNDATRAAILAYERASGMNPDGLAGPLVENMLRYYRGNPARVTPAAVQAPAAAQPPAAAHAPAAPEPDITQHEFIVPRPGPTGVPAPPAVPRAPVAEAPLED